MPGIQVVRVTENEAAHIVGLIDEYCESASVVVRDDDNANALAMWIALRDDLPAGCVVLRPLAAAAPSGEIKRLFVRPSHRGLGVAALLLGEVERFAANLGLHWLYLDTTAEMHQAQRLYARSGYQPCAPYNDNPQASIYMRKAIPSPLRIRLFESGDEESFCKLNEAWIEKYFQLEEKDLLTLRQPDKYILAIGGQIFMAVHNGAAVGCCALLPMQDGSFELSKMGVAETERGRGIGRRLIDSVIAEAKNLGISRLYLETNSKLENAIRLYRSVGFTDVPPERLTPSPYRRADVYMELILTHLAPSRD